MRLTIELELSDSLTPREVEVAIMSAAQTVGLQQYALVAGKVKNVADVEGKWAIHNSPRKQGAGWK